MLKKQEFKPQEFIKQFFVKQIFGEKTGVVIEYVPSLDFSDNLNSQYVPLIF